MITIKTTPTVAPSLIASKDLPVLAICSECGVIALILKQWEAGTIDLNAGTCFGVPLLTNQLYTKGDYCSFPNCFLRPFHGSVTIENEKVSANFWGDTEHSLTTVTPVESEEKNA